MALIGAPVAGSRRTDRAEKISTRLVRDNDIVVLENLNITGMIRKPKPKPKPDPGQPGAFLPNRALAGLLLPSPVGAS